MTNTFNLYDPGRFGRILIFVVLLHLIFLAGLDSYPQSSPTLRHKMATLFDVAITQKTNQRSPKVAINIAPQNHASLVLQSFKEMAPNEPATSKTTSHTFNRRSEHDHLMFETKADDKPVTAARKRVISAASYETRDAEYLSKWQTYIEKYGNTHYPANVLKGNLRGNLRLLVAINQDGSLREVTVRQSSGSKILDQAAINIVLKAAPFDPLPPELAEEIDVLEIIRTWQFRGKLSTSG